MNIGRLNLVSSLLALTTVALLAVATQRALAATATGSVSDSSGRPVAGASVMAARYSSDAGVKSTTAVTAVDGSYSIEVPDGGSGEQYVVIAKGYGLGGGFSRGAESHAWVLGPPADVTGRVLDPSG